MRRGNTSSKFVCLSLFQLLIIILLIPFAFAQVEDSDADRVIDSTDVCPSTNYEEGLPIITQNKEFLGCSCSQIYEKIGEYCYDVFCSTNRPFSMTEREYSSREMNCEEDYCINNELYDFPENKKIRCIDGKEESFSCNATIIKDSELCINGSVAQFISEQKEDLVMSDIPLLDDYEKLQERAYELSQNTEIKIGLGISGEEIFLKQSEKTMDALIVEKNLKTEIKVLSNTEKTISTKTIKIIPDKRKTFKTVYIFEELPRSSKVDVNEIIPNTKPTFQDEKSPVVLVWKIDKISKPVEITYQINKPLQGESNTLIVAKEIQNGFWKLMIFPIIFIIIVVVVFVKTSQKAIPKRKRIFKD